MMECGCSGDAYACSGICVHAMAAGRPRLTKANAADWKPKSLSALRATRNDEDGEAMLWYWQLEGRRWNLDGKTFDTAKKAYGRLVATDEERTEATAARYGRATSMNSPTDYQ